MYEYPRINWSAQFRSKEAEIEKLKSELKQATASLEAALESASKAKRRPSARTKADHRPGD